MTTHRFGVALAYANTLHASQTRKGSDVPYIAHLLAVASLTLENGGDEDQAIGALLHDAVEDQGGMARADDIGARFGDRVRDIVLACTDAVVVPKPDWATRKRAYIAGIATKHADAVLVTLADKVHNAQSITDDFDRVGPVVWTRFSQPRTDTIWYYSELARALALRHPGALSHRLLRLVAGFDSMAG